MTEESPNRWELLKMTQRSRRNILKGLAAGGGVLLAGCGADGDGGGDGGDGDGGGDGGSGVPQQVETKYWQPDVWTDGRTERDMGVQMTARPGERVGSIQVQYAQANAEFAADHARWLVQNGAQLGIEMEAVNATVEEHIVSWTQRGLAWPVSSWVQGADPQRAVEMNSYYGRRVCGHSSNFFNYCNPRVTELVTQYQRTANAEDRLQIGYDIQEEYLADYGDANTCFPDVLSVANTRDWTGWVEMPANGLGMDFYTWSETNLQPQTDDRTLVKAYMTPMTVTNLAWGQGGAEEYRMKNIWDTFYDISPDLEVVPRLATSHEFVDETTVDVELRDTSWHDGTNFTPEDVKFSTELFIDNEAGNQVAFYEPLDEENPVEVISNQGGGTVRFNLSEPDGIFGTQRLIRGIVYPKHKWQNVSDPTTHQPSNPVGTGPFKWVSWSREERMEVERFDDHPYWDDEFRQEVLGDQFESGEGIDRVVRINTGNIDSSIGAFEQGTVDTIVAKLTESQYQRAREPSFATGVAVRNYQPFRVLLDHSYPMWRDKEFRRAFVKFGIDRAGFVETVLNGRATLSEDNNILPTFHEQHWGDAPTFEFNPGQGRQILEQAGYTWDGQDRILYPEGEAWEAFYERIQVENTNMTREELGQPDFS